ncbi:glycoside hydrolase family 127 protein [Flectobacillus rivi]|uniref:Glycoside hydrolase family 127 protein n=1 Tax=Flectobacillus rivi TaxID=2984209 RepID=A0ABT6Z8Z4_9BACT|nr:glycoside hydrolase family 127 protein [Flectobacillus rivi]MDI9877605.1 glycoside hydrolase family 127 protein [Flectobacillus rivi]
MKNFKKIITTGVLTAFATVGIAQNYVPETSLSATKMKVNLAVPVKAHAFNIGDVTLKESIFAKAMEADVKYLKEIDPDRLLSQFRTNAGLKAKGEKYGGWENDGLAGHTLGHYLSACSMYYAGTKDKFFLDRVNYIVKELAECQKARGTGYVGAIPNEDVIFYKVMLGNIQTGGFGLNGGWAPWYTIHKVMAGLLDANLYCNSDEALRVEKGMADWTDNVLKGLNYDQVQKMLRCEYGGMAEALVNTYALTGEKKYLDLSERFHDNFLMDSLEVKVNALQGKHSNTNIPKVIGSIRRYELTGNKKDFTAADFLWDIVINHHTYAPGGNGNYEYFGRNDQLNHALTDNTMETCATYNMLKLTEHLFTVQPKANYMDYYERALYNHILASQNRKDGMSCYFMPLRMGTKKEFSDQFNTFTCCVGTTLESHVKYTQGIYNKGVDGSLYVNLFIPSELTWQEKNLKVSLDTQMPKSESFTLTINTEKSQNFAIKVRKPYWLKGNFIVKINNKIEKNVAVNEEGYIVLTKEWKNNDNIQISLPMGIHAMSLPDNQNRMTFFYGPIALAGDLGKSEPDPTNGTPVFVTSAATADKWIKVKNLDNLTFTSSNTGKPNDVNFKPFYEFTDDYYSVYWDVFTPEKWTVQQKVYQEEKLQAKLLADRTVDVLRIGEMQPERDHNLTGENLRSGEDHTRKYTTADNGGYISFTLKVDENLTNNLILTYWGMDNRGRIFHVLVDGQKVAEVDVNKYKLSQFYDINYTIPKELTQGKKSVVVKLQAIPNNQVGPIYGVRIVKEK